MAKPQPFDEVAQHFADYYETVRGHVRQEVTRNSLAPFVAQKSLEVADIGGGAGGDSEWLVKMGHKVTLVDLSKEQIRRAMKRDRRITVIRGDERSLLQDFGEESFDLVLSHGVLMYDLADPQENLNRLVRLLRPKGILSLLTKGYGGVAERYSKQGKRRELEDLETSHQFTQKKDGLGQRAWALAETELETMIVSAGASVLDWWGVRVETDEDYRKISDVSKGELDKILAEEIEAAGDPARKTKGQLVHFIAERTGTTPL